jgi:hypothetical protein
MAATHLRGVEITQGSPKKVEILQKNVYNYYSKTI